MRRTYANSIEYKNSIGCLNDAILSLLTNPLKHEGLGSLAAAWYTGIRSHGLDPARKNRIPDVGA